MPPPPPLGAPATSSSPELPPPPRASGLGTSSLPQRPAPSAQGNLRLEPSAALLSLWRVRRTSRHDRGHRHCDRDWRCRHRPQDMPRSRSPHDADERADPLDDDTPAPSCTTAPRWPLRLLVTRSLPPSWQHHSASKTTSAPRSAPRWTACAPLRSETRSAWPTLGRRLLCRISATLTRLPTDVTRPKSGALASS